MGTRECATSTRATSSRCALTITPRSTTLADLVPQSNQKPARKRRPPQQADALGGPLAIREAIFAQAGLTLAKQAALVRAGVQAIEDALQATVVQRLVVPGPRGEGASVEAFVDVDHGMRLRAADQAASLVGGYPSRSAGQAGGSGPSGVVNVNVTLKDMSPATRMPVVVDIDGTPVAPQLGTVQG